MDLSLLQILNLLLDQQDHIWPQLQHLPMKTPKIREYQKRNVSYSTANENNILENSVDVQLSYWNLGQFWVNQMKKF